MSQFQDRELTCVQCQQPFTFSAGEQQFFEDKGLTNEPKRCKPCKKARQEGIAAAEANKASGEKTQVRVQVTCADCGQQAEVPFYPSQGRPVYCRPCHKARQTAA